MKLVICLLACIDLVMSQACVKFKHTARSEAITMAVTIINEADSQVEDGTIVTNEIQRFDIESFDRIIMTAAQEEYPAWSIGLTYDETFPTSDDAKCTSVPAQSGPGNCTEGGCCHMTIQAYATYTDAISRLHLKARTNIRDENGDRRFLICEQEFEKVQTDLTTEEVITVLVEGMGENYCADSPCDGNAACTNGVAGYTCACNAGYTGDGYTAIAGVSPPAGGYTGCTDVDECAEGTYVCAENAYCDNAWGSYVCNCNEGFAGEGKLYCENVDECVINPTICGVNAYCTDSFGSFSCECDGGYTASGMLTLGCRDINECSTGSHLCASTATCTNTIGHYTCACNSGYTGTGFVCTDINECYGSHGCSANGYCQNSPGSYGCACSYGYTGDGWTCTDINECSTGTAYCHANAVCANTLGGHTCTCGDGFYGDGTSYCNDVDECQIGPCSYQATCTNNYGGYPGYTCTCNSGYAGDGYTCNGDTECGNNYCTSTTQFCSWWICWGKKSSGTVCVYSHECYSNWCHSYYNSWGWWIGFYC